ncbi:hypothetical protein [Piscinibacter defluvii]|uniref:hypothetical protein n=1 Tax=Piscinibacter defluvii TaxID=1796922 RepID=UPI000FDF0176|nr:hypothetical protein [Piscinibacter defluvii]
METDPHLGDSAVEAENEVDPYCYPVHRQVPAAGAPRPESVAPRWIFELASSNIKIARFDPHPGKARSTGSGPPLRTFTLALREAGATRCMGGQYPSDRWTAEREEKERARRARQRPPRPPKGAKTRGRKLFDLIGNSFDFDV